MQTILQDFPNQNNIIIDYNFTIFFIPLYFYMACSSHFPQLSFCYQKLLYGSAFLQLFKFICRLDVDFLSHKNGLRDIADLM